MRASYWCITFVKVKNILKVKKSFLEFQIPTKNNYLVLVYVESYTENFVTSITSKYSVNVK